MGEIEKTNVFDLKTDCLSTIFKYLQFEDLIALKEASSGFHDAVLTSLREIGEISLSDFESVNETKAFFRDMPFKLRKLDMKG